MDSSMATNEQAAWIVKVVAFPSHVQINEKIPLGPQMPTQFAQPRKGKVEEGGKKKARKVLLCLLRPATPPQ